MNRLRTLAVATLIFSAVVLALDIWAACRLPQTVGLLRDMKRRGADLHGTDPGSLREGLQFQIAVTTILAAGFIAAAIGLFRTRRWARSTFLLMSIFTFFYVASGFLISITTERVVHLAIAAALVSFGWWFLYRSRTAAHFVQYSDNR
ncbi:MAG TPA: hypothetical protein VER58_18105 [Thermoanaerobaculia bacterium]|nr:hypothetical protein [Thermoanaerobaculia bacterium]